MENTQWVEMTRNFKEYKKGEKYLIDETSANELIDAELAKKANDPSVDLYSRFEKTMADREQSIVDTLTKHLSTPVDLKFAAVAKDHNEGSLGEFLIAVGKTGPTYDNRLEKEKAHNLLANKYGGWQGEKSNLNQSTTTQGGFLVPEQWLEDLIYQSGYEGAAFPNRVTMFPMNGHYFHAPTLDQTVTPDGVGSSAFYGGVSVAIVAEGTAPGANTQPAFKSTLLTAKKILATSQVTTELLDNSPISVEPMLSRLLGDATKAKINHRIFNGSGGSSDLLGVIGNACTISCNRAVANTISYADVCKMYSRLAPASRNSAKWVVNPYATESLYQMTDKSGRAVYLQGFQSANDMPKASIFGLEVITSEALPSLGTTGDIILYDPNAYFVGMNKNVLIDSSIHYAFTSDITTYRLTVRLDGSPALTAPILLMDGVSQVSPFVQLSSTVGS